MNNYKTLSEKYYNTFYSIKENMKFSSFTFISFSVFSFLFLYTLLLTITAISDSNFLWSHVVISKIRFLNNFKDKSNPLIFVTVLFEIAMLFLSDALKKHKEQNIRGKLIQHLSVKEDDPIALYKQKWLCKTFQCFEHELAEKANLLHQQIEMVNKNKKQESFTFKSFLEYIYSKDSKPRILALFLALVSLSVGLLSKDPHFKPEVLFSFFSIGNFLVDLFLALLLIGFCWFTVSLIKFITEFFSKKRDMSILLINDMVILNEIVITKIN